MKNKFIKILLLSMIILTFINSCKDKCSEGKLEFSDFKDNQQEVSMYVRMLKIFTGNNGLRGAYFIIEAHNNTNDSCLFLSSDENFELISNELTWKYIIESESVIIPPFSSKFFRLNLKKGYKTEERKVLEKFLLNESESVLIYRITDKTRESIPLSDNYVVCKIIRDNIGSGPL